MKDVYTLQDLPSLQGSNARLAVIGQPVAHSASPGMHQAALDLLEINSSYIRLEVSPGEVANAISQMRAIGFKGCNVTVPHKQEVMECCDEVSPEATSLGVVNTVVFGDSVFGHNTDALGFTRAIREEFGKDLADLNVMILGAGGGAGRAIATHCARLGCERLWLVNRTVAKVEALAQSLSGSVMTLSPEDEAMGAQMKQADLIINSTSLGMKKTDPLPCPVNFIQPEHLVYDMVYRPERSAFLQHAETAGARTANGLSMLLHQGALAFECWFPESGERKDEVLGAMRSGLLL